MLQFGDNFIPPETIIPGPLSKGSICRTKINAQSMINLRTVLTTGVQKQSQISKVGYKNAY